MSYVTGSHTAKIGGLLMRANAHTTRELITGGISLNVLNGMPASVVVSATPFSHDEQLNSLIGLYAQDQWRIKRLTVNAGLRFDVYHASVPEQHIGPGPFVPNRDMTFAAVDNVPNWKDISPRLGVAWDLFGNGKTAIKATFNKYLFGPDLLVFSRLGTPVGALATTATRTWGDANKDFIPQADE